MLTWFVGSQPLVCSWSLLPQALVYGVSEPSYEILNGVKLISHPAASYAVASEASSYSVRAKTQGLGWSGYGLGTMVFGLVMPYLYVSLIASCPRSSSRIESKADLCILAEP